MAASDYIEDKSVLAVLFSQRLCCYIILHKRDAFDLVASLLLSENCKLNLIDGCSLFTIHRELTVNILTDPVKIYRDVRENKCMRFNEVARPMETAQKA